MPAKWEITLPWPDKALSPNARCHWSVKSAQVKRYRYACKLLTLKTIRAESWDVQSLRDLVAAGGQVHVFLDFYPPDRRARDDDNVVASFKGGRDGLADALKIDDSKFRTHPFLHRDDPVKGGAVRVVVTGKGPVA